MISEKQMQYYNRIIKNNSLTKEIKVQLKDELDRLIDEYHPSTEAQYRAILNTLCNDKRFAVPLNNAKIKSILAFNLYKIHRNRAMEKILALRNYLNEQGDEDALSFNVNENKQDVKVNLFSVNKTDELKVNPQKQKYTFTDINNWLFNGNQNKCFPRSKLGERNQKAYVPKQSFHNIKLLGAGTYSSRIGIHSGSITDLKVEGNYTASIGDSNNGDLLTGCGYAVAKAIINAAGAGLQQHLYNEYGVPSVMQPSKYGLTNYEKTEGRGYAITCDSFDMKETHGIDTIEFMTVPMYSEDGVVNMYYEAFVHSKDKDFIAMPLAGMTHPVINNNAEKNASLVTSAFKKFVANCPESKLKVIFTIYDDPKAEIAYKLAVAKMEK